KPPSALQGFQPWMVVAGVAVVLLIVLLFFVKWWAAIMIASAVGLYADASLARITRVKPTSPGSPVGPMIWGLIGFAFVVGPAIYILLRPKLLAYSPDDIEEADVDEDELEEEGKMRAPSLASPGVVLVLAGAIGLGYMFPKPPWLTLKLGKDVTSGRRIRRSDKRNTYDEDKPFHALLRAHKALDEEYKTLNYTVVPKGGDEEAAEPQEIGWDEEVAGSSLRIWVWQIQIDEPGAYVLKVTREDGKRLIRKEFRIRRVQ
ncbi:unnamed protein product, partial [marine sediment metagenome]